MLLRTIFILYLFGNFNNVISNQSDQEPSPTNVKEITVSIEHNSDNRNEKNSDDPKKNPLSQRTRANLLLNSKVIYPPGAKTASAFNQGILKFQQLLELPLNETSNTDLIELKNNNLEETFNKSGERNTETKNITIINEESTEDKTEETNAGTTEDRKHSNCGNSSVHGEPEVSLRVLKNNFIEDFGTTSKESSEENSIENKNNRTEKLDDKTRNRTQEVELIEPVNLKSNNSTSNETDTKKSSIEILDDDIEDGANSTDSNSNDLGNQTTYLPVSAERKSSQEIIEVNPQKVKEIPLELNLKNSARKQDKEQTADDISQNIKRDILLGNLNPFFSNPSTNSIRNTNSIFFDDMLKKSKGMIGPMNPFVINSISFDGSRSTTSRTPPFARLKVAAPRSSGSVKTLKSISLDDGSSSSFGSKSGRHSSSLGGLSSSLGGSSPSFSSSSSFASSSSRPATVRGRRPGFSRFRTQPSKSKSAATAVETVQSVHLGDGKKDTSSSFGGSPSFSSSFNSGKSSVKTIPSLLIREEDESSTKFSSTYKNKAAPSAVSSASFTFTPSGSRSHGRPKSASRHSKPRPQPRPAVAFTHSPPPRRSKGNDEDKGVQILKSVDYSLPEEVGKSLDKTGPSKFKRKAAFETTEPPVYSMQASVTVDPFMVNLDMYRKPQDYSFNPYLVNTQMKQVKRNTEKSRSFEFRPSMPDSRTRKVKEFNPGLRKNSYFQPSLQFQTITETPQDDVEIIEAFMPEDEVDDIQKLENFESDMLFKPYFATQAPKSFHMPKNKNKERPTRSFHNFDSSFVTQSPRSFQMPESTSYRYFGNVHMIDLS